MLRSRPLALYGTEPMQRWGRAFDALDERLGMSDKVDELIEAIRLGSNSNTTNGTEKCHVLPLTVAANYFAPSKKIYSKPADNKFDWREVPVGRIIWRQNFYTIAHSDGIDNTSLEGFFNRIETHVPDWLQNNGINPVNRRDHEYWLAWFIATQGQRTPYAAQVRREHHSATPENMPVGALIAANLTEAKWMAKQIFTWHWQIRNLGVHQTREELLLGETCVFSHPPSKGLICNIRRQTIFLCSPLIATQCETLCEASEEQELKMIRSLNDITISVNAQHGGYLYRATPPSKSTEPRRSSANSAGVVIRT